MALDAVKLAKSPTRLRQIAFVAQDLQQARHLLTHVLDTEVIYEDPIVEQWGLKNVLGIPAVSLVLQKVPLGGDIIEVVSPFKPKTAAGRLLEKLGVDAAGYMLIMQNLDARTRRDALLAAGAARVIHTHESPESICVQYHPKGIKGGVIPELDSHYTTAANPDPIGRRFSPWHPCGPDERFQQYSAVMQRHADLYLRGAACRLSRGDNDTDSAAKQWSEMFGVPRAGNDGLGFTNGPVRFLPGAEGMNEGMSEVHVGVASEKQRQRILERARGEGLKVSGGGFHMLGVTWSLSVEPSGGIRSAL